MLQIRKGGPRDLERFYPMFEVDFDRKELLPKLSLHTAVSRGDAELLILGYTPPEDAALLTEYRLTQALVSREYADALADAAVSSSRAAVFITAALTSPV